MEKTFGSQLRLPRSFGSPLEKWRAVGPVVRRCSALALGFAGGWSVLYGGLMPFGLGLTLGAGEDCFAACAVGAVLAQLLRGGEIRSVGLICAVGAAVVARWLWPRRFLPAALTGGGALLVSAAAGSGKTKVLVERLFRYVTEERRNLDDFLIPFALWGKVYATRFGDEALDETLGSENFGGFEDFPLRFPDADDRADARLALLPWAIVATNGEACKGTLGFQGAYSRAAKRIVSQEPPPRPDVRDCGTFLQVGAQAMAARRWEANRVRRVRAWVALAFTEGATVDEASAAFARAACAGRPDIELIVQYAMLVLCQCATGTYTPALGEALARWKALLDDTFPSDARVFLPRLRRMHRQAGNLVNRLKEKARTKGGADDGSRD